MISHRLAYLMKEHEVISLRQTILRNEYDRISADLSECNAELDDVQADIYNRYSTEMIEHFHFDLDQELPQTPAFMEFLKSRHRSNYSMIAAKLFNGRLYISYIYAKNMSKLEPNESHVALRLVRHDKADYIINDLSIGLALSMKEAADAAQKPSHHVHE